MIKYRPFDTIGWLNHHNTLLQNMLRTLGVVVLSYVLSFLMMEPFSFSSSMLVNNAGGGSDYKISDFYNYIANGRAVRVLDPDIVLVDIEDFDREEIATLIDAINVANPYLVGIDITFIRPRNDDEHIILSISEIENPILAATVKSEVGKKDTFLIAEQSYFADMIPHATTAIVSLPTKTKHGIIREFEGNFIVRDTLTGQTRNVPSFALSCAKFYKPESVRSLPKDKNSTKYINFPSREFRHLKFNDVLKHPELLDDKIVLLGALTDPSDMHKTPISSDVSGIEIHAYAISTILNSDYLYPLSNFMNWLIAFVICYIFMYLSLNLNIKYKALIMRIIQLILLYSVVSIGYYFFIEKNIVIDFSCTFLMITFGFFASDIYYSLETLFKDIKRKFYKEKRISKQNT